ncbi:ankyrin repeat-containing domain protein [Aspergillus aurantiobrunneus]
MARNLLDIPPEMIVWILKHLTTRSLAQFAQVSREAHEIATEILYSLDNRPNQRDKQQKPELQEALLWAAHYNNEDLMLKMLKGSMKTIKLSPPRQFDAMVYSSTSGFKRAVRFLLDTGISPDPYMERGQWTTPLTGAIHRKHIDIVEMLLGAGADLKRYNVEHTARIISQASRPLAQELIKRGLNLTQTDEDGNTLLHVACDNIDFSLDDIRLMLDNGVDPNQVDNNAQTPICLSIFRSLDDKRNEADIIRLLLSRFPNLAGTPCNSLYHPIHLACLCGTPEIVNLLLNAGADPNRQHPISGQTALSSFSERDVESPEILTSLLKAGASLSTDINSTEQFLRMAIRNGWDETLKVLYYNYTEQLEQLQCHDLLFIGAAALNDAGLVQTMFRSRLVDANSTRYETTALIEACRRGNEDAVDSLINDAHISNFDARDRYAYTAIHAAIQHGTGAERIIRFLLPLVTFDNLPDSDGDAPLDEAVTFQNPEVVSLLVDRLVEFGPEKENLEQALSSALAIAVEQDRKETAVLLADRIKQMGLAVHPDYSPVFQAIDQQKPEIAHMLIDREIGLDNPQQTYTPLMCAIDHYQIDIARKLIDRKVNLEYMTADGCTALMLASCISGDATIVRELLNNGANVNACKLPTLAAIGDAVEHGNAPVVLLLLAVGAEPHGELLHAAAKLGRNDTLKMLLLHGLDINSLCSNGQTPLFCAAGHGSTDNINLLIANGANVHHMDAKGYSPLMEAARHGKAEAAMMLLNVGANANHTDNSGVTPLHLAAVWDETELAQMLISVGGADVNHRCQGGFSALGKAVAQGKTGMVKLLLHYGADPCIQVRGPFPGPKKESLLHIAVRDKNADIARMLVASGCSPVVTDSLGQTPAQLAVEDEVIAALYSRHAAAQAVGGA